MLLAKLLSVQPGHGTVRVCPLDQAYEAAWTSPRRQQPLEHSPPGPQRLWGCDSHGDDADTSLDPGEDVALLSVSFEDAEATQVFPKLYLSPSIEQ
ncbi:hypothetical protein Z043_103086 [Scleropages formosus]|uniref:BRISC and BRCA1-A complex member 2 n=1 Tax=Scleropages formosus TaxID=113540 RepID=A0A0P7Z9S8_SCLFO|nr:hypothetical protein Z043_103086 [Scleropages formosus]